MADRDLSRYRIMASYILIGKSNEGPYLSYSPDWVTIPEFLLKASNP